MSELTRTTTPQTAYSYIRFSTTKQAKGDSLRRQSTAINEHIKRDGLIFEDSFSYVDAGLSGYKGENLKEGAGLYNFIEACKSGAIKEDSVLVIEAIDRLSRQEVKKVIVIFLDLLNYVSIHTTKDGKTYHKGDTDMIDVIVSIVQMGSANGESVQKSKRIGEAWVNKQKNASLVKMNTTLPLWCKKGEDGITLETRPELVEGIKRMFELSLEGMGREAICKKLSEEGHYTSRPKTWARDIVTKIVKGLVDTSLLPEEVYLEIVEMDKEGKTHIDIASEMKGREPKIILPYKGEWSTSSVFKLFTNGNVIGNYTPRTTKPLDSEGKPLSGKEAGIDRGKRVSYGIVHKGYYPAIISEEDYYLNQSLIAERTKFRAGHGRNGAKMPNLLQGVAVCGHCGSPMLFYNKIAKHLDNGLHKKLVCRDAKKGVGCTFNSIPYHNVENFLREYLGSHHSAKVSLMFTDKGKLNIIQRELRALKIEHTNKEASFIAMVERFDDTAHKAILDKMDREGKAVTALGIRIKELESQLTPTVTREEVTKLLLDSSEDFTVRFKINSLLRTAFPSGLEMFSQSDNSVKFTIDETEIVITKSGGECYNLEEFHT